MASDDLFCPNCGTVVHNSPSPLSGSGGYKDCHACGWTGHKAGARDTRQDEYSPLVTTDRLLNRAKRFTNAGAWQASWHWRRGERGISNSDTLRDALKSLGCTNEAAEIHAATKRIRDRYRIAEDVNEYLKMREDDVCEGCGEDFEKPCACEECEK